MYGLKNYSKIIKILKSNNLIITKNWHKKNYSNQVLLRHDVDFSIELAVKLAKFEHKHKVKSSYFFMTTSNMYNLFSKKNIELVKIIKSFGHKISLHFDPTVYKNLKSFLIEKKTFEAIFKVKLNIISIHRPNKFLLKKDKNLFAIRHTYEKKYFDRLLYISDSAGRSVFDPLKNYIKANKKIGLQLLLHPIWWTLKSKSPTTSLNMWLKNNSKFLVSEVALNCKTYKLKKWK